MHGTLDGGEQGVSLDCTHGGGGGTGGAVSEMHKYFIMAVVDDHFDNLNLT